MRAATATKKPEERRTEKRKRKEVYRNVHKQAVYVRPLKSLGMLADGSPCASEATEMSAIFRGVHRLASNTHPPLELLDACSWKL